MKTSDFSDKDKRLDTYVEPYARGRNDRLKNRKQTTQRQPGARGKTVGPSAFTTCHILDVSF